VPAYAPLQADCGVGAMTDYRRADVSADPQAMPEPCIRRYSAGPAQLSRRQSIKEAVIAEGSVRIEDLADRFGNKPDAVHRDLDELVGRGILRKNVGIASGCRPA